MSNQRTLKSLMITHSLKPKDVAQLISVSVYSVRAWLAPVETGKFRRMKDRDLEFIRLKLGTFQQVPSPLPHRYD